jgi:glucose/arabinose dehydrogenase
MRRTLARVAVPLLVGVASSSCFWSDGNTDLAEGFANEAYVQGLDLPVAMALTPDGQLLVTEKESGDVRLIDENGNLSPDPMTHFDVASDGEWGLLGIALHPDYETNRLAYVYYMEPEHEGRSRPVVARFEVQASRAGEAEVVVDDLPQTSISTGSPEVDLFSNIHVGGNLHFGPDGLLYVAVGDFGVFEQRAADPASALGKILRFTAEGEPVPAESLEDSGRYGVFAYGLRNPFDFDFDEHGRIFAVDNGPDACDEINLVLEGQGYGWPSPRLSAETCERRDGEPAIAYLARAGSDAADNGSTVGPSSLLYLADGLGPLEGPGVIVCEVNTGRLRYHRLTEDPLTVSASVTLADDCFTDVVQLADGSLLYTTVDAIHRIFASD